ncbi:hypothetical protein, partial [Streptomyces sp. NPDC005009]
GQVVPAWRDAYILDDSHGRAGELIDLARNWTWDQLDPQHEMWAAELICCYAEEVMKLHRTMEGKDWVNARVQASILAVHLALTLAAGTRTFFTSENHLWHLLAGRLGEDWRKNQEAALATRGEAPEESCAAAITLFRDACTLFKDRMTADQRSIAAYALDAGTRRPAAAVEGGHSRRRRW